MAANDAAVNQALAVVEAKPGDAAVKAAAADATKKLTDALALLSELTKQKGAAIQELPAKTEAIGAATITLNTIKTARDTAAADKVAADKAAADATAKLKVVTDAAALTKANADKAVAAAVVTPEMQKQVTDSEAAMKAAAEKAAAVKAQLDRLNAAKGRTLQVAETPAK